MDPLLKKLQHKGDVAVTVLGAPDELAPLVAAWEGDGVAVRRERGGEERFVLCFVRSCAEIAEVAPAVVGSLAAGDSVLWFAYPKKSSKRYRSDVGRDDSWAPVGALGFEPVRQVAVDHDWSAVRFRRVEHIGSMTRSSAISEAGRARVTKR